MLNRDYYILLSMLETIEKIIRYTGDYHSAEELYQNDRDFDAAIGSSPSRAEDDFHYDSRPLQLKRPT